MNYEPNKQDELEWRREKRERDRLMGAFREEIDKRLDAQRPARAEVGEKDWREPVYGWARNHITDEQHLVRNYARTEVDRREKEATKAGNAQIRKWIDGQAPLDWTMLGAKPIIVNKLRVRLDAATDGDLDTAAG